MLALLLLSSLACSSCSAGGTAVAGEGPELLETGTGSPVLALPVDRLLPGEIVDATGLIVPETCRTASIQHEEVVAKGSQVLAKTGQAIQQGAAMQLNSGFAGEGGLAAAVYRLPVGDNPTGVIRVETGSEPREEVGGGFGGASDYYIGLSDYGKNSWAWHGPFTDSFVAMDIEDVQVSRLGNAYVAVAAFDGAKCNVINVTTRAKRADLIEPPAATGVEAQPTAGGIHLYWASGDSLNFAGYRVYGSYQSFTPQQPQYAEPVFEYLCRPPVAHLPSADHANWYYSIAAVDTAGNEGPWTQVASSTPGPIPDFEFAIKVNPPSSMPGVERYVSFFSDTSLLDLRFNLDLDGDGYFEEQGVNLPSFDFTPAENGVGHLAVQAYREADPGQVILAKAAYWTGRELFVGTGMDYASIEDALAVADPGDTILVYPKSGDAAYTQPAVFVEKANITFKGIYTPGEGRVVLDGTGYDYSGVGSIPRAIFQFQPGADGCVVEGFELTGAHNSSYNGAGIRINQANDITIRDCEIHDNDMGLMSNGNGTTNMARNQVVEFCHVHHNGNEAHAGYNHNFYMGGTSVTIRGCEVNNSLTGHNVKSRARFNRIEWSYIHDSANREFDLVDASGDTDYWGADSVIVGCLIVKDPACAGNKAVIHFGQDGGNDHRGTLWVVNNTIVTPFISPVVNTSADGAGAHLHNNLVWDTDNNQTGQQLFALSGDAQANRISGSDNWLPYGMEVISGTSITPGSTYTAAQGENPPFAGAGSPDMAANGWRLNADDPNIVDAGKPWEDILFPSGEGQDPGDTPYAYRHRLWLAERPEATMTTIGAFTRLDL